MFPGALSRESAEGLGISDFGRAPTTPTIPTCILLVHQICVIWIRDEIGQIRIQENWEKCLLGSL